MLPELGPGIQAALRLKKSRIRVFPKADKNVTKGIKDMLEFPWIVPETVFRAVLSLTVGYFGFVKWILCVIHVFLAGLINHPMHLVLERRKFLAVSTEDLLKADLADFLRLTSQGWLPKSFVIHNETKTWNWRSLISLVLRKAFSSSSIFVWDMLDNQTAEERIPLPIL